MQTIAIVNEKGGTGKTTTAVNLSAALGRLGRRVLLVDLDGQAASSRWFGVEEDHRLADALIRGGGLEPLAEVAPGVALAPASGKLDSVAHELRPTQGGRLRRVLTEHADRYDLALIDCPPSLGNRLIGNALLAASHVIVPVEPSILALDGLRILLTTLEDIRDGFDHPIQLIGVLVCRYEPRTRLSRLVLAELHRALPGKVFGTLIRETVRMQECPASGGSILRYAATSPAALDYLALARELLDGGPRPLEAADAGEADLAAAPGVSDTDRMTIAEFRGKARTAGIPGPGQTRSPSALSELAPPVADRTDDATACDGTAADRRPAGVPAGEKALDATAAEPAASFAPEAMAEGEDRAGHGAANNGDERPPVADSAPADAAAPADVPAGAAGEPVAAAVAADWALPAEPPAEEPAPRAELPGPQAAAEHIGLTPTPGPAPAEAGVDSFADMPSIVPVAASLAALAAPPPVAVEATVPPAAMAAAPAPEPAPRPEAEVAPGLVPAPAADALAADAPAAAQPAPAGPAGRAAAPWQGRSYAGGAGAAKAGQGRTVDPPRGMSRPGPDAEASAPAPARTATPAAGRPAAGPGKRRSHRRLVAASAGSLLLWVGVVAWIVVRGTSPAPRAASAAGELAKAPARAGSAGLVAVATGDKPPASQPATDGRQKPRDPAGALDIEPPPEEIASAGPADRPARPLAASGGRQAAAGGTGILPVGHMGVPPMSPESPPPAAAGTAVGRTGDAPVPPPAAAGQAEEPDRRPIARPGPGAAGTAQETAGSRPEGAPAGGAARPTSEPTAEPTAEPAVEPASRPVPAPAPAGAGPATAPTKSPTTQPRGPQPVRYRRAPDGYHLECVLQSSAGNLAVINGKTVHAGSTIGQARVVQIQSLSVEMEVQGERFSLGVGTRGAH